MPRRLLLLVLPPLLAVAGCLPGRQAAPDVATRSPQVAAPAAPAAAAPAPRAATARAASAAAEADARRWEHEGSDLPVDPRIVFGRLDNGLRYAWVENGEPQDRAYVRLHVDVGSLAERDDEHGLAHFLEHMAFNGSEHYPPGTLVEWFQEHGMAFGADTNAHTAFSETVYYLDLPNADADTLRSGLTVLRDYAGGLLLLEEEIDAEKGVIDAEQRERDSADYRVLLRLLDEQYAGTLYPTRMPIGTKAVRDAFDAALVRAFYERWYRPDAMTLVVVGDLGGLDPAPMIAELFGDLPVPSAPRPAEPLPGRATLAERFFAVHEDEIAHVEIHVERLRPWQDEPDTRAERLEEVPLALARDMLNLRYRELVKQQDAPLLSARVSQAGGLEVYDGEHLVVAAEPERWREALEAAGLELRRALQHGFQQAELDEVRAEALRELDERVEREPTRHSRALLSELLAAAEDRVVPTAAATERALLRPAIEALTTEACHAAFAASWADGVLNVFMTGDHVLGDDAPEVLQGAWADIAGREVERAAQIEVATFAYDSDPEQAGAVVERRHVEDLDLHLVTFANGVRLNVKSTDFKERQVLVTARVAEGLLTLEPERYAVGYVSSPAVAQAGLGAHTADEIRRMTAGRQVGVGYSMDEDAFVLGGATTADDLLLQLELMAAHLADPGWRDDGLRLFLARVPIVFETISHQPTGPLLLEFLPALFAGDQRFVGLPPREQLEAVSMEAIEGWLAPHLGRGPVELTVVGDVEVDDVVAAAARTFGALPERRAPERFAEHRRAPAPRPGLRLEREVETDDARSLVFVAFPTTDGIDVERRRNLRFLAEIVSDRLRKEVRERLGAAYSPGAGAMASETYPGVGLLQIQAAADPAHVEALLDACMDVAADLGEHGVTGEEVARLAEPVLARIRDSQRANDWWLSVLADAQSRPGTLDEVRTVEAFHRELSPERLGELAALYLEPERASVLVVNPKLAAPTGAAPTGEEP